MKPFFASWFDIDGHIQSGYYLGREAAHAVSRGMNWRELALLEALAAGEGRLS